MSDIPAIIPEIFINLIFSIKLYLLTIPVFFLIDMLWLGWLGRGFYKKRIGFILRDPVDWTAVIAFYRIYIVVILAVAVASCHGNRGFPVGHPFMYLHGRRQFFAEPRLMG